uniref:Rieske domain-containing protein n=1 Tax=Clastoptera arizonana TaxID=38151 RepID=A0A1B6CZA7_9HEMI
MGSINCKDKGPNEIIEGVVCKIGDIKENEMKVFDLGPDGGQVLLVHQQGKINAIGTKCSHYGAPLITGALGKGKVRCPWHGACFNIGTGDIEDFPGLDSIPCYQVQVLPDGGVKVRANKSDLEANKRVKGMCPRDKRNAVTYAVIGGGPASANCVEALRQEGFTGRIVMICKEPYNPYDRIKVSKVLDSEPEKIQLRSNEFYAENNIELMKGVSAVKLDTKLKQVELSNNQKLKYDKVFIATGSTPRKLEIPGYDLENVLTLRNIDDTKALLKKLGPNKTANVVIWGSSFIAMEAAASCINRAKSVTVVARSNLPFKTQYGDSVGQRIMDLFREKGVYMEMPNHIEELVGSNGKVTHAILRDNSKHEADIVIMALGSTFNTEFLKGSGVTLNSDGTVPVDKFLETNVKGVYAGGDIAFAPVTVEEDRKFAIGHWQLAQYHGNTAAHNMLGKSKPIKSVPFFWTMLFGKGFRYAGHCEKYDDVLIFGDLIELNFTAYYCDGPNVKAVLGTDNTPALFAEFIFEGNKLAKTEVIRSTFDWKLKVPKGKV